MISFYAVLLLKKSGEGDGDRAIETLGGFVHVLYSSDTLNILERLIGI